MNNALYEYAEILSEIQDWYDEEAEVSQKIEHAKVQRLSSQPVGKGKKTDISNAVALLDKVRMNKKAKIHELYDFILANVEQLYCMDDVDSSFLLFQVYFMQQNYDQIANKRYVSHSTISRKYIKALKEFRQVKRQTE